MGNKSRNELEERIFKEAIFITIQAINVYIILKLLNNKEPSVIQLLLIIIDAAISIPIAIFLSSNFNNKFIERNLDLSLSIIFLISYFFIRNFLYPNINPLELLIEETLIFVIEYFLITFFNNFSKNIDNKIITNSLLISAEIIAASIFETIADSLNGKDNNFIENL